MLRHELRAEKQGYRYVAGLDEAGRGPLAGPVVACSLILKKTDFKTRIDDSKKLTPKSRLKAYKEILSKAYFAVGVISEKVIDDVNIFNATRLAMEEAVRALSVKPDFLLIDGRVKVGTPCKKANIMRGDQISLSIACASIIAKVTRDSIMEKYHKKYPQYNFSRHKGYGTKEHMRLIKKHGPSPIHRRSFHPISEML